MTSAQVTSPLLVDLDEAARLLSISRRLAQQLVYDGHLQSVTLGRRRLIAVIDLETYVARLRGQDVTQKSGLGCVV